MKITHMKSVCDKVGLSPPNCVERDQMDIIGSLSGMQHLFLVSLFVGSCSNFALNMKIPDMHHMFQSYAEKKHVLDETITLDATKSFVEVLVNNNLMTAVSAAHKVNFSQFPEDQVNNYLKYYWNMVGKHIDHKYNTYTYIHYIYIHNTYIHTFIQVSYSLKFPAATLLKYPRLAQMHRIELQRCLALRTQR